MSTITTTDVTFESNGITIAAHLYAPTDLAAADCLPHAHEHGRQRRTHAIAARVADRRVENDVVRALDGLADEWAGRFVVLRREVLLDALDDEVARDLAGLRAAHAVGDGEQQTVDADAALPEAALVAALTAAFPLYPGLTPSGQEGFPVELPSSI